MNKVTANVIILFIAGLLAYDAFVILKEGVEFSVSQKIIEWSYSFPVFTFLTGFTMGHLFWRLRDNSKTKNLGHDESEKNN